MELIWTGNTHGKLTFKNSVRRDAHGTWSCHMDFDNKSILDLSGVRMTKLPILI